MGRAIMIGLLAVLAGFGSWYEFRAANQVASAPIHSAAALTDARPGQRATAYGRIDLPGRSGMIISTTTEERCDTRPVRRSNGQTRYERQCRDQVIARDLPSFGLVLNDGDQPTIRVLGGGYQLEGRMRTAAIGARQQRRGFQNGDSVLVIGATEAGGLRAETVYGGTRDEYVDNTLLLAWGLAALGLALLGASVALVWFF